MQTPRIRVLLVEDEAAVVEFVKTALMPGINTPVELCCVEQLTDAFEHLRADRFDVLLLDLGLSDYYGLEALREARRKDHQIPIVVLSDLHHEAMALAALEQGAQDYLLKGSLTADSLTRSIQYAIQRQQLLAATAERESALESRAKLAAIVEFSEDAIISEALDGCVVSWNQAAERMYGYSAAEVLGRTIAFLIPAERADQFEQIRITVRHGEPCRHFDTEFIRKDGRRIEISLSVSPIKNQKGMVIGISKIGRDIRVRKRAEQALRESQERFELAVRGTSDGVCDWSLQTGEAYWSPRTREMLGYSDSELESTFEAIASKIHPDDRDRVLDELARNIQQGQPNRAEFQVRIGSGEYRWFQGRCQAVYDASGNPYRVVGAMTDITDRKQLEAMLAQRDEQLRQSQKLEAVGSLAGGIAHEFNNLLQAIRGYTMYGMQGLSADDPRHQDLEQVIKAADRAATLTHQLMGFSRQQVLERSNIEPRDVITDLLKLIRPLIGEHIDLEISLGTNLGELCADRGLLQQMLVNLCINARDAMPAGGRLVLKTQRVDLSDDYCAIHPRVTPGAYVMFSVADTGCGMSREVRDRIFEPFFTTKGVGKGTGLGLAMVYGCVQQHGGVINVYSEPDLGTTFNIYLPITVGVDSEASQRPTEPATGGKETILIAEDESMVRDLAVRILTQAGYSVLVAADGAEAVKLFEANVDGVSLALLDTLMPKLTGHQAYDRIKLKNPNLPVVFCSGYDPETGQVKVLVDQGVRMVQKPYDPDVLLRAVREALDARQLLEASTCTA
jgi:two-component system cell cycle sensor histidine kinase/response regulator CckA